MTVVTGENVFRLSKSTLASIQLSSPKACEYTPFKTEFLKLLVVLIQLGITCNCLI